MIVIVVKKLRGFIKGQFWWGCHQNARAKNFVHFSTTNGIAFQFCHSGSWEPLTTIKYLRNQTPLKIPIIDYTSGTV
jgi:hypothetical protein